jgi:hypothetical protein
MKISYTVEHRDGCVLVFGTVPMSALGALTQLAAPGAMMALDLARMAGANLAFGSIEDVNALVEKLKTGEVSRTLQQYAGQGLPPGAAEWLAGGERGVSSNTMFTVLTGVDALGTWEQDHPSDPADLLRCLKLLEQVPQLRPLVPNMRHVSPEWAALVDIWPQLTDTLAEELKAGKSAPRTYALIKNAILAARAA